MRNWIKLYTEIVSDPKMGRLSDRQFRTCINLFALGGIEDKDGLLPATSDIAWHLRISEDQLTTDLQALAKVGILQPQADAWLISKWDDRQAKPPSASRDAVRERVKRYRDKQKAASNDDVTTLHDESNDTRREENRVESDKKELEVEKTEIDDPELSRALRAFENDISLISGSIAEDMADMWDLLCANGVSAWWYTAIKIAVSMNKRNWRYVRGILQNCLTEGKAPVLRTNGNGSKPHESESKPEYIEQPDGSYKRVVTA